MNYLVGACIFLFLHFFSSFSLNAQQRKNVHELEMEKILKNNQNDTIVVAVLLYDNIVLQDFAGPIEVFNKAQNLTKGKYKTFTFGLESREIYTENNLLKITADYTLENFPKADYILIPGASMPVIKNLMNNETLKKFIQTVNKNDLSNLVSVCTASYLLANSGILDGKKATTHYFVADDFQEKFPNIKLIRNVRFVDEEKILTSSGVTSGIDVALYIVGKNSGQKIQSMIVRALQYTYGQNDIWPVAPNGMRYTGIN